ncbi:MAG: hypothetical protein M1831_007162 [Alyxoria varia]|nr:MAG: hypothetical protein M1831_007162 [Alyxoria varia]
MKNNLPGETIKVSPEGCYTIPHHVEVLAEKRMGDLTLETDKSKGSAPQVNPSKKRPAGSEIQVTGPPERSGSPAKLHRTSYGDLSFSRASPERHLSSAPNPGRIRHSTSPLRRSATENAEREAERARKAELLEQNTFPGSEVNVGEDSTAVQKEFDPSPRSQAKAGALSKLPPGPHRTARDVIQQSHAIKYNSRVVDPKQYANLREGRPGPLGARGQVDPATMNHGGETEEGDDHDEGEYEEEQPNTDMIKQPDSRPISQQQLATEVKAIYSGLSMIEQKCVNITNDPGVYARDPKTGESSSTSRNRVDHWQALIALHRTLLHEHHDFFLASQHPAASAAIRELASKYSMPARMWKHGIHNFLELLRHRLPDSLEYMLAFIYLSYQMMALLYETVPSFEETWIECLGDLARYRMAIEDEDVRDRDTWTSVARMWYSKAVDRNPSVGRLYHHLAILSRRYAVQQLSSYARSLTAVSPFLSTRESIMTLFDPILARAENSGKQLRATTLPHDTWFVVTQALLFTGGAQNKFDNACQCFITGLNNSMSGGGYGWGEHSSYFAVTIIASILKYGSTKSQIRAIMTSSVDVEKKLESATAEQKEQQLERGAERQAGMSSAAGSRNNAQSSPFVLLEQGDKRPLPEDFLMRGQVWAEGYFPTTWFDEAIRQLNEDERWTEFASSTPLRTDRVLGLAIRLASLGGPPIPSSRVNADMEQMEVDSNPDPPTKMKWLHYDSSTKQFSVAAKFANARHARVSQTAYNAANSGEADRGGAEKPGDVASTDGSKFKQPLRVVEHEGGDVVMGGQ